MPDWDGLRIFLALSRARTLAAAARKLGIDETTVARRLARLEKEMGASLLERALRDFVRRGQRLTRQIEGYPKPLIVAVNGIAFGAGCEITEAAPLALASDRARFAKPEIRLGFPPPFGGTQRLPRLIGRKRALQMILTAEPIDAQQAATTGLVNRVVEHTALLSEARLLADQIARHSPAAVAACLRSVTRGLNVSIDEGLAIEATQFAAMVPTPDIRRGIDAFLSRRKG